MTVSHLQKMVNQMGPRVYFIHATHRFALFYLFHQFNQFFNYIYTLNKLIDVRDGIKECDGFTKDEISRLF